MQKTKIPWADYTINPVKGLCPMDCDYCYARRMYKRFKWDLTIRWESGQGQFLNKLTKPSRIFFGSTMELFGEWIKPEWLWHMLATAKLFPQHTFIFLTKQPQNLKQWSPFPSNCWIGITTDNMSRIGMITDTFAEIQASVKFLSFEPMLDYTPPDLRYVDWVIIGEQTKPTIHPRECWVTNLIEEADIFHIPVFVKEPLASYINIHRQEFPKIEGG